MSQLQELGLVLSQTKSALIFDELFPDIKSIKYEKPSEFVSFCWSCYKKSTHYGNVGINGKMFEYILAALLIKEGILPFYMQAKVAFIPNVDYDIILYSKESGPIALSIKTSLRERYKQADLEAFVLKNVHRNAKSFLITLEENEAKNINKKIGLSKLMGIDRCIYALDEKFDNFFASLKEDIFITAPEVRTVNSSFFIQ